MDYACEDDCSGQCDAVSTRGAVTHCRLVRRPHRAAQCVGMPHCTLSPGIVGAMRCAPCQQERCSASFSRCDCDDVEVKRCSMWQVVTSVRLSGTPQLSLFSRAHGVNNNNCTPVNSDLNARPYSAAREAELPMCSRPTTSSSPAFEKRVCNNLSFNHARR